MEIKQGAYVDYLYHNRWRYGIIQNIETKKDAADNEYRSLHIQPQMIGMYPTHRDRELTEEYTEEFTLSATTTKQIAKPLTKSVEHLPKMLKWRHELAEESKCDALDCVNKWYTSQIIEVDHGANRFKVHFDGWSARYDEWIYRYFNIISDTFS